MRTNQHDEHVKKLRIIGMSLDLQEGERTKYKQ